MFRLRVAYDGSGFHGWQRQPGLRTVQGELERALSSVLEREAITVHGAGRTDAGVHARGQVASFEAETRLPARALGALASRRLQDDVRILEAREAAPGFHARHDARARRYAYRLLDADDLLLGRIAWYPRRALDPEGLGRAMLPLEGRHDFSAFEAAGSSPADPVCEMLRARWRRWEGGWQLDLIADHFLYHMVRNLVGTALRVAGDPDPGGRMADILAARDRSRAGATAPARGLCLEHVYYEGEEIAA